MSIEVACSRCAKRYAAPDEHAGKRLKCPRCGNAIEVPSPVLEVIPEPEPLVDRSMSAILDEDLIQGPIVLQPAPTATPAGSPAMHTSASPFAGPTPARRSGPSSGGLTGLVASHKLMVFVAVLAAVYLLAYGIASRYPTGLGLAVVGLAVGLIGLLPRSPRIETLIAKIVCVVWAGYTLVQTIIVLFSIKLPVQAGGTQRTAVYAGLVVGVAVGLAIAFGIIGLVCYLFHRFGFFRVLSCAYALPLLLIPLAFEADQRGLQTAAEDPFASPRNTPTGPELPEEIRQQMAQLPQMDIPAPVPPSAGAGGAPLAPPLVPGAPPMPVPPTAASPPAKPQQQEEAKVPWSVKPDPAPSPAQPFVEGPILLGETHRVTEALFSRADVGQVVLALMPSGFPPGLLGAEEAQDDPVLAVYDLLTGKSLRRLPLPAASELVAVSPSAKRALLHAGSGDEIYGEGRCEVWPLDQAAAKPLCQWRMTGKWNAVVARMKDVFTPMRAHGNDSWEALIDDEHALTHDRDSGDLILRKLPEGATVYHQKCKPGGTGALSPGGKYVALFDDRAVRFLDALSGKPQGDLVHPTPHDFPPRRNQAAFSLDGTKLAAAYSSGDGAYVIIWDLESGKATTNVFLLARIESVKWIDQGWLWLEGADGANTSYLMDTQHKAVVWRYTASNVAWVGPIFHERAWAVCRHSPGPGPVCLAALPVPDEGIRNRVKEEFSVNRPPLFGSGAKVTLDVSQLSPAGMPGDFTQQVQTALGEQLRQRGVQVADGQPLTLVASYEGKSDGSVIYRWRQMGPGQPGTPVPSETTITYACGQCRLMLKGAAGTALWQHNTVAAAAPPFMATVPSGQDPVAYVRDQGEEYRVEAIKKFFLNPELPGEIPYQPRDGEGKLGLGSSALDGAKFAPTPQRPSLANLPGRARPGGPGGAADFPLASPLGELGGSLDKANRDYTRQTFIEVIVGDEAELQKRLRWFAAAKRPAIGLRWGLGIQGVGQARLSSGMAAEFELSRITGPIGPAILEGLQQRVADGQFGQWSKPRSIRVTPVALLGSGNQRELLRSAERCGVHALLLCDLATKTVGLSKKTDMVMKVQLLDVATQQAMWTSKPLSSRAVGRGPGSSAAEQFVADVLAKVDEQFALKPMPAIKPEHVQRRLATLRDETAKSPDPLTLLAELRYYQTKQLATAEDLLPLYDAVLGAGKGQTFSGGSAQQRRTVLQAVGE